MIDLPILNIIGWGGFIGLMIFYWLIGTGRPAIAYWASIFGAACFLAVGIASMMGVCYFFTVARPDGELLYYS